MSTRHTKAEIELLELRRIGRRMRTAAKRYISDDLEYEDADVTADELRALIAAWDAIDTTKPVRPKARKTARKR